MELTSGYSISFPVFSARMHNGSFLIQGEIHGTAFALGGEYMLTAGHVAEGLPTSEHDIAVVGITEPLGGLRGVPIHEVEPIGADIALLRVHFSTPDITKYFHRFKWSARQLDAFSLVRCVGYAYGIHRVEGRLSCVVRGFQGHIVSDLLEFKPLGAKGKPFQVYELSYAAPRGLSGSPLLSAQNPMTIHGVVIGNSQSRMLVFQAEERIAEGNQVTSVEQYESLQLGIAVKAEEVLSKSSKLLGGTIEAHLRQHDLIAE